MAKVTILGAGVMGSAMAMPAAAMGHQIALVGTHLDEEIIRSVRGNGRHPRLNVTMPEGLTAHLWTEFAEALADDTDLLILGVSSLGVDWAIDRLVETLARPIPVLMITKGLKPENGTFETFPDVVAREIERRRGLKVPVMAVAGPCIAGELAALRDTAVVMTGTDRALVERTIGLLAAPFYHARASGDVVGVEICAAFKNFFAIGVGWSAGALERHGPALNGAFTHNLSAGLFTEALTELGILVEAFGGEPASAAGLAGVGDLYVTCQAGRNSRLGRWLGLGLTYGEAKAAHMPNDTIEGADLARAVGPVLEESWRQGRLPAERMPLARAIVAAICRDRPLTMDWTAFHRAAPVRAAAE